MAIPAENVEWSKIPAESKVELRGSVYVVTLPDGSEAVAFWGSQDARQAQRTLDRLAAKKSS